LPLCNTTLRVANPGTRERYATKEEFQIAIRLKTKERWCRVRPQRPAGNRQMSSQYTGLESAGLCCPLQCRSPLLRENFCARQFVRRGGRPTGIAGFSHPCSWTDCYAPRIEPVEVSRHRLHNLEGVPLDHPRLIGIFGEVLAPSQIVLGRLPLPVKYEGIPAGDRVQQDVPGHLRRYSANLPAFAFLCHCEKTNHTVTCMSPH
jgi:hypothetical protein